MSSEFRMLELYSGIGGMHCSLRKAIQNSLAKNLDQLGGTEELSIRAVDINPTAKTVYQLNFPDTAMEQLDVRALKLDDLEGLWMLTMSPPCQPFSRNGNVKDIRDFRCESFMFVLNNLSRLKKPPKYIAMENVKGFETSGAHKEMIITLKGCGYCIQQYLLSPVDFGIPNSRLRYYMTASRTTIHPHTSSLDDEIRTTVFDNLDQHLSEPELEDPLINKLSLLNFFGPSLIEEAAVEEDDLFVPIPVLRRYLTVLDVKFASDTSTNCFTSGYGRYLKGTGSVFCPLDRNEFDHLAKRFFDLVDLEANSAEADSILTSMKIRFFSPREIAKIMGFPVDFEFPVSTTTRQRWRLFGNSLNVEIVSKLMESLLCSRDSIPPLEIWKWCIRCYEG